MSRSIRLATLGISLCAAPFAWSQQPPVFIGNETVVTAGRIEQRLADTLGSVTVITARDIEQASQLTLAQVLQQFGGIEMAANGGQGNAASVFIRGTNSSHALVLVDGIRLGSATSGSTAFENIPIDQIERIEIVAGPVSGLYGSDAIGGVIQIFTKSGRYSPGITAAAGYGTYNTRSARASVASKAGDTDFTLAASYFETEGFSATLPSVSFGRYNPDDDGYRNTSFSGKVSHRFDPRNELGASVFRSQGLAHFDNGPTTDNRTDQTLTTYSVYSRNQLTQSWESLVRLGSGRDDSASLGGATVSEFRTDQDQATWQNTVRLGTTSLIAGVEYLGQKIDTTTAFAIDKRTIRSAFAGFSGDYGSHGLQANVRRDDNSQFGGPTTGSVAYGYRFTPEVKVRAAYGTAFHAPTFNDLYFPGFGNADLQPERSRNVGVRQPRLGPHRLHVRSRHLDVAARERRQGTHQGAGAVMAGPGPGYAAAREADVAGSQGGVDRFPTAAAREALWKRHRQSRLRQLACRGRGGRERRALRFGQRGARVTTGRLRRGEPHRGREPHARLVRRRALGQRRGPEVPAGAGLRDPGQQRLRERQVGAGPVSAMTCKGHAA